MVQTAEVAEPTAAAEPIEAVIISGPRRGEIIRLPEDAVPEVSDEDIQLLNQALDQFIAAIDRYTAEVRATTQALREPVNSA